MAFAPIASQAVPVGGTMNAERNPNVIAAAVKCGPHAHYIRGHRNKAGQWVLGRCVRDRRH